MRGKKRHMAKVFGWGVSALALLVWTGAASAQTRTGTSGSSFGNSSFGSSSGGGSFSGTTGFSGGSFSGSSIGGGSFSGSGTTGFSGGSFSGSSSFSGGSFSGSSSFGGGSFSGSTTGGGFSGTTGGGGGISGITYQGVSNTNPFYQTYQNPLAMGMSSGTSNSRFGVPMYNLSQSGSGSLTGGLGTTGGVVNTAFNPSPATYLTTPYTVSLGPTAPSAAFAPPSRNLPPAVASRLQLEAQQVINRSSALPSKGEIRASVVGPAVVLRGVVSDEHERALAEGLLRLEPGINNVVNELRVANTGIGASRPVPPP